MYDAYMYECMYLSIFVYVGRHVFICHKGVVFQTIRSFVHALDVYLQMTEATNK